MRSNSSRPWTIGKVLKILVTIAVAACLVVAEQVAVPSAFAAGSANTVLQIQRSGTPVCLQNEGVNERQLTEALCMSSIPTQRWFWISDGSTGSKFVAASTGSSCMNVQNSSNSVDAKIVISDCAQDSSQSWLIFSTPTPNSFILQNVNSHLCITRAVIGVVQEVCSQSLATQNFLLNVV